MSVKININKTETPTEKTFSVLEFDDGELFKIGDGYGIRTPLGWITIDEDELTAFVDTEIEEYTSFKEVTRVDGTLTINLEVRDD